MSETRFIVTTGAESSGKTTLAHQLSRALASPLVEEASRGYLNEQLSRNPDYRYTAADLCHIARCQHRNEQSVLATASSADIVCDTDLLVLLIWHEERFGPCDPAIRDAFDQALAAAPRHYLLCDWRIPWQPDPLRENPDNRDYLFRRYQQTLQANELSYTLVTGSPEARLAQALESL